MTPPRRPFQFTIAHLGQAMFVLALCLGIGRMAGTWVPVFFGLNFLLLMAFIAFVPSLDHKPPWVVVVGLLGAVLLVLVTETLILFTVSWLSQ